MPVLAIAVMPLPFGPPLIPLRLTVRRECHYPFGGRCFDTAAIDPSQ